MVRPSFSWAAVAVLSAAAAGCSTRAQVRQAPGDAGILRSYAAPFEQVRRAANSALEAASLPPAEDWWIDRHRWSVLGAPAGSLPAKRAARIVVEDHPTDCRVWTLVQSKPDVVDEAAAEDLQVRIARALGLDPGAGRPPVGAAAREERYRSPIARCSELTAKACRARGYAVVRHDDADAALRTIAAEKKPALRLFAALYRHSDSATRVVIEVRGGSPHENQDEAAALHEELLKDLFVDR